MIGGAFIMLTGGSVVSRIIRPISGETGDGLDGHLLIPSGAWLHLARLLRLSSREMQIVQHVFDDRKLESIAFELGISPKTVETYFQRLYTKLHVSSRPQLILRVMAVYLLFPPSGSPCDGCRVVRASDR
jgi:DNA-binding NarL/FixJ family response regulator